MKMSKKIIALITAIALLISGLGGYKLYSVYAAPGLDESKCVTYAQFSASHTIPDTTIFIGTHLIMMDSATDELWMLAQESQSASSQTEIYYKSELSGGAWYSITDINSINEISDEGIPIDEAELSNLLVEYYTFEDGQTRAAVDDGRHCIFDREYPYYDLYHLEELGNLRTQYDTLVSRDTGSRMDNYYIDLFNATGSPAVELAGVVITPAKLGGLYKNDLRNDVTEQLDNSLYALQDIYDALNDQDRSEDAQTIYELMARLDHGRRAEIFRQLIDDETTDIMNNFINKASGEGYSSKSGDEDEDEEEKDFITNYDIVQAASDDMGECETSYLEHSSNSLIEDDGARVIDTLIYNRSMAIINSAQNGLDADMDNNIRELGYLFNIDNANIVHMEEELAVLQADIIDEVSRKFSDSISQTPNQKYRDAQNAGLGESALKNILDEQETDIYLIRLELQDMLTAEYDRMPAADAVEDCKVRIDWTFALNTRVSSGDFKPYEEGQISLHIEWLTQKLKELLTKLGSANSELDNLMEQYDDLLNQQQQALDDNDLAKAKEIGENLNILKGKIDDANSKLQDVLNDPNASASDKALAQAMMGDDSLGSATQGIVDGAINDIINGNFDGLDKAIDALGALGDVNGLNQIKDELDKKAGAPDSLKNKVGEAISDAGGGDGTGGDGTGDGAGGGDGTGGDGTGDGIGGATEDDLLAALEGLLGDLGNLSPEDLASAIRALELVHRDGSLPAGTLAAKILNQYYAKLKKYVYARPTGGKNTYEYVDLDVLSNAVGYRYLYTERKKLATVTNLRAGDIYKLVMNSKEVKLRNDDKAGDLVGECLYSNDVAYATVDFASDYLDSVACHIRKSSSGLVLTKPMEDKAQDLYQQLKDLFTPAQ